MKFKIPPHITHYFKWMTILGLFLSGLSIFALLNNTYQFGLSSTVTILTDWYARVLEIALSWIEPIVNALIAPLPFDLRFSNPAWREFSVVLGIYSINSVKFYIEVRRVRPNVDNEMSENLVTAIPFYLLIILVVGLLPDSYLAIHSWLTLFMIGVLIWMGIAPLAVSLFGIDEATNEPDEFASDPNVVPLLRRFGFRVLAPVVIGVSIILASAGLSLLGL